MKVVLLNPPNFGSWYINRDLMGGLGVNMGPQAKLSDRLMTYLKARSIRLPVMSLAYSAAVLSPYADVSVIDAANLDLNVEETAARVGQEKPDILISTTSISALFEEAAYVARLKERLNVTVGLTGDAATSLASRILEQYSVDFIVRGDEPEFVVGRIAQSNSYRNLKGVVYREDGVIKDGGDPGSVLDLDSLAFPKWELFPLGSYRYFPILRRTPFLTVLSTRGCPYGCVYCPYASNQGPKYRFRSPANVTEELMYLKTKFGVASVLFRDPTFTLRRGRTLEICDQMIRQGLDVEWGCETRVDCLDGGLIERMVEAGLRGVNIGIESSDPKVIRNVKRGWIDPQHIKRTVTALANWGVRVSGFFVLGLPGESPETVERTLEFALELPLAYAEFKIGTPFPGTLLFEMAKEEGWIRDVDVTEYTSYTPTMRVHSALTPDYLKEAASRAYRAFYMRPRKILKEVMSESFLASIVPILLDRRE